MQPVLLVHHVEAIDFEVWRAVGHGTGRYHGVISREFTITYYRALLIAVPLNGGDTEERQVRQETRRAHQLIKGLFEVNITVAVSRWVPFMSGE